MCQEIVYKSLSSMSKSIIRKTRNIDQTIVQWIFIRNKLDRRPGTDHWNVPHSLQNVKKKTFLIKTRLMSYTTEFRSIYRCTLEVPPVETADMFSHLPPHPRRAEVWTWTKTSPKTKHWITKEYPDNYAISAYTAGLLLAFINAFTHSEKFGATWESFRRSLYFF